MIRTLTRLLIMSIAIIFLAITACQESSYEAVRSTILDRNGDMITNNFSQKAFPSTVLDRNGKAIGSNSIKSIID